MSISHIFGYGGAVATGIILGLLGGGGALLSIPTLVYLFGIDVSVATGYSLFLVAVSASTGAIQNIRKKMVDLNAALYYGIPSVITVYVVRRFVIPALPKTIFAIGDHSLSKDHLILFVLSTVMFGAGYKMITSKPVGAGEEKPHEVDHLKLTLYAILIGSFLGLVGAGGGFLMVPALVYFANLDTKRAIATSLVLVAINSTVGFIGDVHTNNNMDWPFLMEFSLFSIAGVFIGNWLSTMIDGNKLKAYFGWFVITVAVGIVLKETVFK